MGVQWFVLRKTIILKGSREGLTFSGGGGVQTYRIRDFTGGLDPLSPSGSAHAYDKSSVNLIPKDRFSHATVHFT